MAVVIADAGPLIALAKVDRLAILRGLFGTVRVLLVAEQRGLIESAESVVNGMAARGYRISAELLRSVCDTDSFGGGGS
ncbi:DUF3368 domain-containing protein [Endothiovibrio diazotrophicus]